MQSIPQSALSSSRQLVGRLSLPRQTHDAALGMNMGRDERCELMKSTRNCRSSVVLYCVNSRPSMPRLPFRFILPHQYHKCTPASINCRSSTCTCAEEASSDETTPTSGIGLLIHTDNSPGEQRRTRFMSEARETCSGTFGKFRLRLNDHVPGFLLGGLLRGANVAGVADLAGCSIQPSAGAAADQPEGLTRPSRQTSAKHTDRTLRVSRGQFWSAYVKVICIPCESSQNRPTCRVRRYGVPRRISRARGTRGLQPAALPLLEAVPWVLSTESRAFQPSAAPQRRSAVIAFYALGWTPRLAFPPPHSPAHVVPERWRCVFDLRSNQVVVECKMLFLEFLCLGSARVDPGRI